MSSLSGAKTLLSAVVATGASQSVQADAGKQFVKQPKKIAKKTASYR